MYAWLKIWITSYLPGNCQVSSRGEIGVIEGNSAQNGLFGFWSPVRPVPSNELYPLSIPVMVVIYVRKVVYRHPWCVLTIPTTYSVWSSCYASFFPFTNTRSCVFHASRHYKQQQHHESVLLVTSQNRIFDNKIYARNRYNWPSLQPHGIQTVKDN